MIVTEGTGENILSEHLPLTLFIYLANLFNLKCFTIKEHFYKKNIFLSIFLFNIFLINLFEHSNSNSMVIVGSSSTSSC